MNVACFSLDHHSVVHFIPGLSWFQNVGLPSQINLVVPFQFLDILIEIVQWLLAIAMVKMCTSRQAEMSLNKARAYNIHVLYVLHVQCTCNSGQAYMYTGLEKQ